VSRSPDTLSPDNARLSDASRSLTRLEVAALEMAAHGCVSGRLGEWPGLRSALLALELPAWPWLEAGAMRLLARDGIRMLAGRAQIES